MPEVQRVFFDIFALEYYDEEYAKALKAEQDKQKFARDHKMEAPVSFETHQELLRLARENTDSEADLSEDGAED
jgi:hypothetical protein